MKNTKHKKTMEKIIQKIKREHDECYAHYLKLGKELRDYEECNRFIKKNECYVATVNDLSDFYAETNIKVHDSKHSPNRGIFLPEKPLGFSVSESGPLMVDNSNLRFLFEGRQGIIPNYNFEDVKDESAFRKKYKDYYQRIPSEATFGLSESCWVIPLQIPFDWIDEMDE